MKISFIDYIKHKYDIENLEEIISLLYLSLLISIVIYIASKFEVIQMAIIIFFVLLMLSYIINKYYEKKYEKQMLFVKNKFGDISILLNKIINKDNKDNNKK
tara:strand:+ start:1494 stop:1799 length:306 start_codon:yes stop_codon:yes gene_type:complete